MYKKYRTPTGSYIKYHGYDVWHPYYKMWYAYHGQGESGRGHLYANSFQKLKALINAENKKHYDSVLVVSSKRRFNERQN